MNGYFYNRNIEAHFYKSSSQNKTADNKAGKIIIKFRTESFQTIILVNSKMAWLITSDSYLNC